MIINLMDEINNILDNNDRKIQSIENIKKEVEAGMDALRKNDEVIYIIKKSVHIKAYPLFEVGKLDDIIRKSKDFNKIHEYNSLKEEADKILKELKVNLNDEQLKLINEYVELKENQPLFAVQVVKVDTFKQTVLSENIGVYFNSIFLYLAGYLNSLELIFDEEYVDKKLKRKFEVQE